MSIKALMKQEYLQIFPFYGQIVDKSRPLK